MKKELIFLKLGGSLITDKNKEMSARKKTIRRLAMEIRAAREERNDFDLLLGHGSGSYGHFAAKKYGTRTGVKSAEEWQGFAEVWAAARELHQIVVDILNSVGLPLIGIAPSSVAVTRAGKVASWDIEPIRSALENGLIPIVYGDVVFDSEIGGSILSTEEIFLHLSAHFSPSKILLAANEAVYEDFPKRDRILEEINPRNFNSIRQTLSGGEGKDVTGGMLSKVEAALEMLSTANSDENEREAWIFSGENGGQIKQALINKPMGTRISG